MSSHTKEHFSTLNLSALDELKREKVNSCSVAHFMWMMINFLTRRKKRAWDAITLTLWALCCWVLNLEVKEAFDCISREQIHSCTLHDTFLPRCKKNNSHQWHCHCFHDTLSLFFFFSFSLCLSFLSFSCPPPFSCSVSRCTCLCLLTFFHLSSSSEFPIINCYWVIFTWLKPLASIYFLLYWWFKWHFPPSSRSIVSSHGIRSGQIAPSYSRPPVTCIIIIIIISSSNNNSRRRRWRQSFSCSVFSSPFFCAFTCTALSMWVASLTRRCSLLSSPPLLMALT